MTSGSETDQPAHPVTFPPPRQDFRERHQTLARRWYLALLAAGSFQVDRTEALQKLFQLTDKIIAFLFHENLPIAAAGEIGVGLAELPCTDPHALEISGQLWAGIVGEVSFLAEPARLYPRLAILLNGMAAGFFTRARQIILDEQEEIRSAMASDLKRTTRELRKYQTRLEAMLEERTRELRESEERFRIIADTSIEGIFQSSDKSASLIYLNDAYARMLGYKKEELLGRSSFDLIADDDFPKLSKLVDDVKLNLPVHGEIRLKHKQGHLIDVHFSMVPTILNGRSIRSGILLDITEQKRTQERLFQSEERYRTLSEASPDMIFIIDPDDRVQYANSYATAFLNLPLEQIIGQPREHFFPSPSNDHQRKNLLKVLKNGKMAYAEAVTRRGGKSTWLGTWLVPLRDASRNISGVLGISRNITRQKRAEMEIRRSRDLLERRVEERTAELTTSQTQLRQLTNQLVTASEEERRRISRELHDETGQALISLKYSLASIESNILANNEPARERLADSIAIVGRLMEQIRTLTHSLRPPVLEVAGINLCLKDFCDEISKRSGLLIQYQGIEIPDLPDEISISLYRFVQEALTNILKHARATQVKVRLQYRKGQIILAVSDNGRGMENKIQSNGIGLIGIEERLSLIGGFLKIHTRSNQGVRITAFVPWPRQVEN